MKKNERAITLISLAIEIIIILIIAGISVSSGTKLYEEAKLEELRTNMLLIQAKAREYVEEANFEIGFSTDATQIANVRQEVYETKAKLTPAGTVDGITPTGILYKVTDNALKAWGLGKIEKLSNEEYMIDFNDTSVTVEIYNVKKR